MYRLFPFVNLFYLSAPEPTSGRGTVERSETGRGLALERSNIQGPEISVTLDMLTSIIGSICLKFSGVRNATHEAA